MPTPAPLCPAVEMAALGGSAEVPTVTASSPSPHLRPGAAGSSSASAQSAAGAAGGARRAGPNPRASSSALALLGEGEPLGVAPEPELPFFSDWRIEPSGELAAAGGG